MEKLTVHAQANSTSSAAATNMTSAGAHKSTMGAAGNITIVLVTMEVNEGKKQEAPNSLIPLGELAKKGKEISTMIYIHQQKILMNWCSFNYGLAKKHLTGIIIARKHLNSERR